MTLGSVDYNCPLGWHPNRPQLLNLCTLPWAQPLSPRSGPDVSREEVRTNVKPKVKSLAGERVGAAVYSHEVRTQAQGKNGWGDRNPQARTQKQEQVLQHPSVFSKNDGNSDIIPCSLAKSQSTVKDAEWWSSLPSSVAKVTAHPL